MLVVRHLRALARKTTPRAPKTSDSGASKIYPPILRLPLDVWFLFLDHLELHDQLRLSHTCKHLRALAGRHLPEHIRNLCPLDEPVELKSAFASLTLDYEACIYCTRFHLVNVKDVPFGNCTRDLKCEMRHFSVYLYACYVVMGPNYRTQHRHVQLALKYHRNRARLEDTHKQHLEELMKPCLISERQTPYYYPGATEHTYIHYTAQPKIAAVKSGPTGHALRYIVHEEWTYSLDNSPEPEEWTWGAIENRALRSLRMCTHQDSAYWHRPSTASPGDNQVTRFTTNLEVLIKSGPGKTIDFSCSHCPTDICFRLRKVRAGRHCIWVDSWKDIGTTKHEWEGRVVYKNLMRDKPPPNMKGYVSGITRYLYENDGCRPKTRTERIREVLFPSGRWGWVCRAVEVFKKGEQKNKKEKRIAGDHSGRL